MKIDAMTFSSFTPESLRKQLLSQSLLGAVWVLICMAPLTSRATETAAKVPLAKLDYRFDGRISRPVLENYMARSATVASLLHLTSDDDLRMMQNTGVKFAGRVIWMWGSESRIDALAKRASLLSNAFMKWTPTSFSKGPSSKSSRLM